MTRALAILAFSLILAASGCGTTERTATHYSFPFEHDGLEYEIVSVVLSDDGGHNYLTQREDGELLFSAKDEDQNGTVDTVLVGDLTVETANVIYLSGIEYARNAGRYREEQGSRVFEFVFSGQRYVVQSFVPGDGEVFNFITYRNVEGVEVIGVDAAADGTVDRIKKGPCDLSSIQPVYAALLDAGVGRGRISVSGGRYVVRSYE